MVMCFSSDTKDSSLPGNIALDIKMPTAFFFAFPGEKKSLLS